MRRPTGAKPSSTAAKPQVGGESVESVQVLQQELQELRDTVATLYARGALLDAVIQSLPIWITVEDINGRYLLVNQALADANGIAPGQYVGKTAREVLPADKAELDALGTLAHMVLTSGKPVERPSYVAKLRNGSEQVRRMLKLPLHDSEGATLGVIGWSEDITQRIEVEESLDRNRRLLQTLFEVMPHPLSYIDRTLKFRMVNLAWCEALEVKLDEVLGRTILEIDALPVAVRQALWDESTEIYRTGNAPGPAEHTIPTRDGRPRFVQISKAPLVSDGRVDGLVTLSIDVTSLRAAEQAANLAHQRLSDALESIPAAIFLYDEHDKLILANTMAKGFFPSIAQLLTAGTPFVQLLREVARSSIADPVEQAQFIEQRQKEFRHIVRQIEQTGPNGQFLLGHDRRTTEGGTVSIRFDITEQKRIQTALERRERQTRTELVLAAELQRNILRDLKPPPFIAEAHEFRPSSFVSGDVFHSATTSDGSFLFFLGDATGHGVSAALITMLVEATLSSMPDNLPLDQMADQLNSRLVAYRLEGMYVSGIFIRVTPAGELSFANAGHPAALVVGNGKHHALESSGPPMGWFERPGYASATLHLSSGDKIVLLTDGLTEWADADGNEFGTAAVDQVVDKYADHPPKVVLEALMTAAAGHAAGQECADDLTLFVMEYRPRSA
jgi:PAS domain S-box-containing protein